MYTTIISEAKSAPKDAELFYNAGPAASVQALSQLMIDLSPEPLTPAKARLLSIDFYTLLKGDLHTKSLMNLDFRLNNEQREDYVNTVVNKTLCLLEYYQALE